METAVRQHKDSLERSKRFPDTIKVISFDLDGTLADSRFDELIWVEEIPKIYAEKNKMSIEAAKEKIYALFYRAHFIERDHNWANVEHWFAKLGLGKVEDMLADMKKHVCIYPDTIETLRYLSKKYPLIVVSNAEQRLLSVKLAAEGINSFFTHAFSAPSSFGIQKKNKQVFLKVLERLNLKPHEVIHVGDDHYMDYIVPQSMGMHSLHLVRSKDQKDEHVIHSLAELKELL